MMEIIELDASMGVRGVRNVVVGHSLTGLTRGLEPRESVVVHTADGDFYAGQVTDIQFELEDTLYSLEIGARLPSNLAVERVEGLDPAGHDLSLHEIVDLLGQLRDEHRVC